MGGNSPSRATPAADVLRFRVYSARPAGHICAVRAKPPGDRSAGNNRRKSDPAGGAAGRPGGSDGAEQPLYVGQYQHALDAARRLQLPAQWRRAGAGASVFYLLAWPCGRAERVRAFNEEQFRRLVDRLCLLTGRDNAAGEVLSRQLAAGVCRVELDSRGRLVLPGALAEAAGLKGQVVLLGVLDSFEIWDADRFHADLEREPGLTDEQRRWLEL
jgi:MraZ protein